MHQKLHFLIGILVLSIGACSPVKNPTVVTATPILASNTPTTQPTVVDTPLPTPELPLSPSTDLVEIQFLDAMYGWGVAASGTGSILRTVDTGLTWFDATPPGLTGIGYSTCFFTLDVEHAWVLVPNADFFTGKLYITSDAGLTWSSVDVPFGGGLLQFLDSSTGRLLVDRGVGAGSQVVELFQSSDGGSNWISVFNDDPTRPDASGSLPFSGIKNGMSFLDHDTGWVTGTRPISGEVYLYKTQDGGIDWELQTLSLPAGYESFQYLPQAPFFFGSDGFLPLIMYLPDSTVLTFFVTHDGGATWSWDPANSASLIPPGHFSFSDVLHGWSWDGGANIYFTDDGALTWKSIPTTLDLADNLAQLVFKLGTNGQFTGWALTGPDATGHSKLFMSHDDGSSWIPLIP